MARRPDVSEGFLYLELARQVAEAIRAGSLQVGDRIASVRRLSRQHQVSISTAVQALRHLENQRLIEARPKSGFFVARQPAQLLEPATSRPPAAARYVVTPSLLREYLEAVSSPGTVRLGSVLPEPSMFPAQRIGRAIAAATRSDADRIVTYYGFSFGAEELRQVIARRSLDCGVRTTASEVIVTAGCIEAITLAVRAVARPGDTIALESPTYFLLLQTIESLGMKALEIPTHPRTGLSLEALDLASHKAGAVKALIVMPTFANPLGSNLPDENRRRLVALCAQREIAIVEDDVYGEVAFASPRPRPLKAWDRSGNVLLCSSFSKTVAPGLRVGWILPGRYQREVEMLKFASTIFTPHAAQLALAAFVANGGYDHHLRKLRAALAERARRMREAVEGSFPAECRITRPAGGYVFWIELPPQVDAVELFRRAREENIVIAPGPLFSNTNRFSHCIRLSFSLDWSRAIDDAIARLGQLVQQMSRNHRSHESS